MRVVGMEVQIEPFRLLLLIGANLFGIYAIFKSCQVSYWFIKDRISKREEL